MTSAPPTVRRQAVVVDGRRVSCLVGGSADRPALVFVHGLLADSTSWARSLPGFVDAGYRVIAVDLLGHGASDKPADIEYDIAGFAETVRGVLDELGVTRATLVGHSLGGGIVIGVSHLHPERVHRLVLVASGGFGTELHAVLRHASTPGARTLLRLAVSPAAARVLGRPAVRRSLRVRSDAAANLARMARTLRDPEGMSAFYATHAANIDRGGQRGSMVEMGYVDADLPTLLVWCERDPIIPVAHAQVAAEYLRTSRLELFPGVSHEPHHRHPQRFVRAVTTFLAEHP